MIVNPTVNSEIVKAWQTLYPTMRKVLKETDELSEQLASLDKLIQTFINEVTVATDDELRQLILAMSKFINGLEAACVDDCIEQLKALQGSLKRSLFDTLSMPNNHLTYDAMVNVLPHLKRLDLQSLASTCLFFSIEPTLEKLKQLTGEPLIAAGKGAHSYYIDENGLLWGCGSNCSGQLGLGDTQNRFKFELIPLPAGKKAKQIAVGSNHTVVLCTDGSICGSGENAYGQLGLEDTQNRSKFELIPLPAGKKAKQIAAGSNHTIVLCTDGSLCGCGFNGLGHLGLGDTQHRLKLELISLPVDKKVNYAAAGVNYTVVICTDGSLLGCGSNKYGQLGLGDTKKRFKFELSSLPADKKAAKITAGTSHTVVLCTDGSLLGCGSNSFGQLGLGDTQSRSKFELISSAVHKNIKQIAAGTSYTVVLCTDGSLGGCGSSRFGRLLGVEGTQRRLKLELISQPIANMKVSQIAGGDPYMFALCTNGSFFGCGFNGVGQLGLGDKENCLELELVPLQQKSSLEEDSAGNEQTIHTLSNY